MHMYLHFTFFYLTPIISPQANAIFFSFVIYLLSYPLFHFRILVCFLFFRLFFAVKLSANSSSLHFLNKGAWYLLHYFSYFLLLPQAQWFACPSSPLLWVCCHCQSLPIVSGTIIFLFPIFSSSDAKYFQTVLFSIPSSHHFSLRESLHGHWVDFLSHLNW